MNKKILCAHCRRSYPSNEPLCIFCGEQNPALSSKPNSSKMLKNNHLSVDDILTQDTPSDNDEYEENEYETDSVPAVGEDDEFATDTEEEYGDEYSETETFEDNEDEEVEEYVPVKNRKPVVRDLSSTGNSERVAINWSDEKVKATPDYTKMYDKNGNYNANFDGYYDDTLPRIQNEIDNLLKGKEKTILKIVCSVVGVIAVIIYLILTL